MATPCFNRWLHWGVWERLLVLAQTRGSGTSLGIFGWQQRPRPLVRGRCGYKGRASAGRDTRKAEALPLTCSEHWMHWRNALLFRDALAAILAEPAPMAQKTPGHQVAEFAQASWAAVARDVVFRGNVAKSSQHPALLERLRAS